MPPFPHRFLGRIFEAPPMPPEAFPPGLLSKQPAVHAAMEQAWRTMFLDTLTMGVILGAVLVLAVIVAVLVRSNLTAAIQGAIHGAIHQPTQ